MLTDVPGQFYQPFNESFELLLNKQLQPLNSLGCDYFYFLVSANSNKNKSYRFCTHEDWIDFYHFEKLIQSDPLKRIAQNLDSSVIPWKQVSHSSSQEKKIMEGREDFGLYNGLSITCTQKKKKYIFVLATEYRDHDLARFLLIENRTQLEVMIQNCMRAFSGYSIKG